MVLAKLPTVLVRPVAFGRTRIVVAAEGLKDYLVRRLKWLVNKLWHFILEAKDLKPTPLINQQVQKVKRVFRIRIRESEADPQWLPEVAGVVEPKNQSSSQQPRTAEELYLETIKQDPNNKQAYEGLGRLYLQEKNYTEAVETFKFLTRLEPKRDIYWSNLGLSLYSTKQFQQAVTAYEKAIEINNKIPTRWVNLALCYDALQDSIRTIKALNQALQLDSRNINYLNLLADAYTKIGNKVRAEDVLSQILKLDPSNKNAREKLMKIRM